MAGPELSVICRKCGSEVSPYVTECPYCGTRLRKRAPRLERQGDEIKVREGRHEKKLRRDQEKRARSDERRERVSRISERREELATRPVATVLLLAVPALIFVIFQTQGGLALDVAEQARTEPQRYAFAPFFFEDAGYLFICAVAIAIFFPPLERRFGSLPTLILGVGCGVLGILAADGVSSALGDGFHLATGANGIALGGLAAYVALREPERREDPEEGYDPIAVGVAAALILGISFIESLADPFSALAGGLVGGLCGLVAVRASAKRAG